MDLKITKNQVIESFFRRMDKLGLIKHSPEPIIPNLDNSILFTNSTIVALKRYLGLREIATSGYYLVQNCVRFKELNSFNSSTPTCFTMVGAYAGKDIGKQVFNTLIDYLLDDLKVKKEDLIIVIPGNNLEIWAKYSSGKNIIAKKKKRVYQWNFGIPKITGKGIAFGIKQLSGEIRLCGNMVALLNEKEEIIGFDYGFGVEVLLSRINQDMHPVRYTDCYFLRPDVFNIKPPEQIEEVSNLIALFSSILSTDPKKGVSRRHYSVFRKVLKYLVFRAQEYNFDTEHLIDWIDNVGKESFPQTVAADRTIVSALIQKRIRQEKDKKSRLQNWLKSQEGIAKSKPSLLKTKSKDETLRYLIKTFNLKSREAENILLNFPNFLRQLKK